MAQLKLSYLYENGLGVSKNIQKAVSLNIIAAENGNIEAQYKLGYRFFYGEGVEKNINSARKWITSAASKKHHEALALLKQLRLNESNKESNKESSKESNKENIK